MAKIFYSANFKIFVILFISIFSYLLTSSVPKSIWSVATILSIYFVLNYLFKLEDDGN